MVKYCSNGWSLISVLIIGFFLGVALTAFQVDYRDTERIEMGVMIHRGKAYTIKP